MASRIPFDFALMDARHRPFVEGRRDDLLTFFQIIAQRNFVALAGCLVVGGLLLVWGSKSLIYDFSVKWISTEAVITQISPMQSGKRFNWWYLYTFKTKNGQSAEGKIVLDNNTAFLVGDRIPVVYVSGDPADNHYAKESMPRTVRDWFFVATSAFLLSSAAVRLHKAISHYRTLCRLARNGRPLPGKIVKAQLDAGRPTNLTVDIEYMFSISEGNTIEAYAQIPPVHLAHKTLPESGTVVAVWYAAEEGAVLI